MGGFDDDVIANTNPDPLVAQAPTTARMAAWQRQGLPPCVIAVLVVRLTLGWLSANVGSHSLSL